MSWPSNRRHVVLVLAFLVLLMWALAFASHAYQYLT